ncbi:hypothetical protein Tco_1162635 [Tanacetum coccineum]
MAPLPGRVQLLEIERINKEESFKKKNKSIEEIISEKRLIDDEIKDITNDLSYKRFRGEKIDDNYERDCEIKINQLLQDYNGLDIEMWKKERDDSIPLRDIIARYSPSVAITFSPPVLPTREPEDSLIMGDEHLDTIPEKESDEFIKSSIENLVPIPSESEDFSDNESECDMPVCDDFTTFSNPLFDSNDDFTSSDDESLFEEDILMENFKIYSNPLFDDEEIISPKIDPHYFNVESNLIEYLFNHDILIDSSPKFDYLLEEFSGELAHIDPIPPRIEKADFDLEEEIRLPDTGVVTTKVVKGISEHYVLMPNILPTLPTFDSDLDFTPSHDSFGSGNKIFDPGIFIKVQSERLLSWDEFSISFIHDPLFPVFDLLLPFSFENEDKVFNPGILISPLLSHRGEIISNFSKSPMMISGGDIPHLHVSYLHLYPL